ncbi:MAG: glycosyltransferase, partial [Chitinivibrionales bacterium]|nr:glycosyltransferase [Chitinivibrionales bacterium]MBD3394926.1 glycosyltransferase [Chitinivibrionales bacterium]
GLIDESRIVTVPCGRPDWHPPVEYRRENRARNLFYVGNYGPRKNLVNLVKALEILHAEGITVPLHMAGPRTWKSGKTVGCIERSPVKEHIRPLGYLSDEGLREQFLSCRAFVYPSFFEGFGIPVLEALCLDCPVLTSKGTVMEEVAKDAALYFDPFDPADIARVIKDVWDPGFDHASLLLRGAQVLEKYTWDAASRRLLGLLREASRA